MACGSWKTPPRASTPVTRGGLGSIGDLGTYSFHETKNYICGEGGALCINEPSLIERAEIIRDKGTNRRQFSRGQVDKYTWVDVGSSYVPSEVCSAFLYAQLEMLDSISDRRRGIHVRRIENCSSHSKRTDCCGCRAHPRNVKATIISSISSCKTERSGTT